MEKNQMTRLGQRKALLRQILLFSGMILVVLAVGASFLGVMAYRSAHRYHEVLTCLSQLEQIKLVAQQTEKNLQDYLVTRQDFLGAQSQENLGEIGNILATVRLPDSSGEAMHLEDLKAIYTAAFSAEALDFTNLPTDASTYQRLGNGLDDLTLLSSRLIQSIIAEEEQAQQQIWQDSIRTIVFYLFVMALAIIATAAFGLGFSRSVDRPIQQLVDSAQQLAEGQYQTPDILNHEQNEIGYLIEVFNDAKHKIAANVSAIERQVELQKMLQRARQNALQSQTNPHFLFNVLSLATEAALHENADHTIEVIEHITRLLRLSLQSVQQPIRLSEELRMVDSYLYLQKQRFGDRITLHMERPAQFPDPKIPGMTIQPMLENAFKHGTERLVSGGVVSLVIRPEDAAIHVEIKDNGPGIEKDRLAVLVADQVSEQWTGGGIGIANVIGRMELFYQRHDLVKIESEPGQGTVVRLTYPFQASKERS